MAEHTHVPGHPPICGRKAQHVEGARLCMMGRNPIFYLLNILACIFSFIFLHHNHWFALLMGTFPLGIVQCIHPNLFLFFFCAIIQFENLAEALMQS